MSSFPSNDYSSSYGYGVVRPSPSLAPQQVELNHHEASALHDDPSNDFLSLEGFDPSLIFPPQVPPPAGYLNAGPFVHSHAIGEPQRFGRSRPHGPRQPASSGSFPEPVIHPAVAPQSSFDGTYSLRIHPPAWHRASPSSLYSGGEQAAFAGGQNMAVPGSSMSGTMPMAMTAPAAAPSFSPMHFSGPTSVSPAAARTPIVLSWDAAAAASAPAVQQPAPATFCRCNLRPHPFVRVDDTIEWVRSDLMRMSIWFNWSPNAEAEAHESWEPRRG